jgi:hypothetical protein
MSRVGCTYKEWIEALNHDSWRHIGEWAYPKRENASHNDVFYHYCGKRERKIPGNHTLQADKCQYCEAPVPDGVKMIVLLTEKL